MLEIFNNKFVEKTLLSQFLKTEYLKIHIKIFYIYFLIPLGDN